MGEEILQIPSTDRVLEEPPELLTGTDPIQ